LSYNDGNMAQRRVKVLFVTSELYPLIKTGGLADVSASLPAALLDAQIDVRILLPGYTKVLAQLPRTRKVALISDVSAYFPDCVLRSALAPQSDVPLLLLDCPTLYDQEDGPYQDRDGKDLPANHLRFGLLGYVAALLAGPESPLTWQPDIIHCNDWQSGLAPAYLRFLPGASARSVATIHNLAFQGIFPPETLPWLSLPVESFQMNGLEYYGGVSFLKAALFYADRITTVSPTYAKEIQQEPLGMGLQGLLTTRSADLIGILNGIDEQAWNPATDPHLPAHFSAANPANKRANKLALQQYMELTADAAVPLLGIVSRLTHQKGIDMIVEIMPQLMARHCQLAILGSGDAANEAALLQFAAEFPGRVAVKIGFDERLSHLITAGIDMFLMPSRFEPCGLNQMYSQRYGSPPIVSATGGLADTVTDCADATLNNGSASGIVLHELNASGLLAAIDRALGYFQIPAVWQKIQHTGMARDFSWKASARSYVELYRSLLQ
jgi:starch synthase